MRKWQTLSKALTHVADVDLWAGRTVATLPRLLPEQCTPTWQVNLGVTVALILKHMVGSQWAE